MKKIIILFCLILIYSCKEKVKTTPEIKSNEMEMHHSKPTENKKSLSPHTNTMAMVGNAHVHIDYSSPGVRKRIIFGGLLPYDEVWQAGAHNATWFETNKDLIISGKELKSGKYGFFVIPNTEQWTIIFNSNWDQHGKDEYDEKDDVLRFKVIPEILDEIQENLEYKITKIDDKSAVVKMQWEKVSIAFPIEVK